MPSKSTNYYRSHADSLKIKRAYQSEYNKKPAQKKKKEKVIKALKQIPWSVNEEKPDRRKATPPHKTKIK